MAKAASLPIEWQLCAIADVSSINPKVKLNDDLTVGFMPMAGLPKSFFGTCKFEEKPWNKVKKGFTQFRNGDVIFAKITPCFENGKAAIIKNFPNEWGAGSTEYIVLRPQKKLIIPELLFAFIKTRYFKTHGTTNMSGSVGHKRVPKELVEKFTIPIPPLPEQKVIAEKLDRLLAQVERSKARLQRIPQILKRFRQSVLAAAVSGKLTEGWREKNICTKPNLSWPTLQICRKEAHIPNTWESVTLGSVCERVSVGHVGKTSEYYTTEQDGIPFFRSQNIRPGKISTKGLVYIEKKFHKSLKKSTLMPGDLLVVRVGANRGDSCILPEKYGETNCANIILARPQEGLSNYLNLYFQSPFAKGLLLSKTVGGAQGVINTKSVAQIFLALPPEEEQNEIVRRVEELITYADKIEQQVNSALAKVEQLSQSILAKAFRGELTEQWRRDNPDLISGDNSAAALLERIRAERTAAKATPRKRRKTAPA